MAVTLQDIADIVGVSRVTVSKVLRGKVKGSWPRSAEQVRRIHAVADDLGYRVDWRARALKTKKTHMIGLLSTDKPQTRTHDHQLLSGLIEELNETGYHLVFVRVKEGSQGRDFADNRFDGLLIDYHVEPEEIEIIQQAKLPAVIINAPSQHGIASVMPDHHAAGVMAAEHLLGLGHRRIGFVQSPTSEQALWPQHMYRDWRSGIVDAMTRAHCFDGYVDVIPEVEDATDIAGVFRPVLRDLLSDSGRPTALIVNNVESMAEGVLPSIESLGLRCPEDLSLMTITDRTSLSWCRPPVTAVALPFEKLGRVAAGLLLELIDTDAPSAKERTTPQLPLTLNQRDSTGPCPEKIRHVESPQNPG